MDQEQREHEREHLDCHRRVDISLQVLQAQVLASEKTANERAVRLELRIEKLSHALTEGSYAIAPRLAVFESNQQKITEQIERLFQVWRDETKAAEERKLQAGVFDNRLKQLEEAEDDRKSQGMQLKFLIAGLVLSFIFDVALVIWKGWVETFFFYLMLTNISLGLLSSLLEKVKDKTSSKLDDQIYVYVFILASALQKLVDLLGGNRKHKCWHET